MVPDLHQDFNMMEKKKENVHDSAEELESIIQEQFKKKNHTHLLPVQQIADFMTTNVLDVYPAAKDGMAALNMSLGIVTLYQEGLTLLPMTKGRYYCSVNWQHFIA